MKKGREEEMRGRKMRERRRRKKRERRRREGRRKGRRRGRKKRRRKGKKKGDEGFESLGVCSLELLKKGMCLNFVLSLEMYGFWIEMV